MKTAIEVCQELVRLYDAGLRPQIVIGCHREEQDFYECVKRARKLVLWRENQMRQTPAHDAAHDHAMNDACYMGQNQ